MIAADRLLLETSMRQSAIKLREKELNLYCENFSSVGTQAAVMAGFTTTCFIEISIPDTAHIVPKNMLHLFAVLSICFNLTCVSLSTIVSVWGSGMALRGKDGSMDDAVQGMGQERDIIFRSFFSGLFCNLCTIIFASWILMDKELAMIATVIIAYSIWMIYANARRITKKFHLAATDTTRLGDLTGYDRRMQTLTDADIENNNIDSPTHGTKQRLL
jgi:hypothetical protein